MAADKAYRMVPIPAYGDHFTLEEMAGLVASKMCIDYDGCGQFATATEMAEGPDGAFSPSNFEARMAKALPEWTHVVWFNR